ncbi:MAG: S8 family serine peptidase [Gemmataceae bacterium]
MRTRRPIRRRPSLLCEALEDRSLFDVGLAGALRAGALGQALQQKPGIPVGAAAELADPHAVLKPTAQGGAQDGSVPTSWLGDTRQVVPGSWAVRVDGSTPPAVLQSALTGMFPGASVAPADGLANWYELSVPGAATSGAIVSALSRVTTVGVIQPEFADYHTSMVPNDPLFRYQDHLHNTGYNGGVPDADIDAPETWGQTGPYRGGTDVLVAVVDTGVDYTHPDLYRNIWLNQDEIPGFVTATDTDGDSRITFWDLNDPANAGLVNDFNGNGYIDAGDILLPVADGGWMDGIDGGANGYTDDLIGWDFTAADSDPADENGHGTHVAGILGATGNDSYGVSGVLWKTQIAVVRGLDADGFGSDFDLAAALGYSVGTGARVTNTSWGGAYSTLIDDAVVAAGASGTLIAAAAGNDVNDNDAFPDYSYPASLPYDNVISVGATDNTDYPAYFTNYGATSVDLAAPGVFVLSTVPTWWYGQDSSWEYFDGTSMAAPQVAGAAALLWSASPGASLADIRAAILGGVDLLPDLDPSSGFAPMATGGRLDLFGAFQQLNADKLIVLSSTPGDGVTVTGPRPTAYTLTFNGPVQLSANPADLQAGDFSVNGAPATGVSLSPDGLTATFTFAVEPIGPEGLQSMTLAPGSVRRADTLGTTPGGYEAVFRYDSVPLTVTGTSPAPGSVLNVNTTYTMRVYFNEPFDPSSLTFFYASSPTGFSAAAPTPVAGNTAADITFNTGSLEGNLTVYVFSESLTDVYGNPNPTTFTGSYSIDVGTRPYPVPLASIQPLGSMIAYNQSITGLINPGIPGGDTDDFTITLDGGQTVALQLFNVAPGLRGRVQVYSPTNVLLASMDAATPGQRLVLQSVPAATSGVYTIRVAGLGGTTGNYTLFAALNVDIEEEGRLPGVSNNTPATAQSINGAFVSLSTDLARGSRGAISGATDGTQYYGAASAAYAFEDISTSPTANTGFSFAADDSTFGIALPAGDSFTFYGTAYTSLYVSSNGLITFGSANASLSNSNLSSSPPQAAIAAFWRDLVVWGDSTSNVFWEVRGSGASRRLVVQWNEAVPYGAFAGDLTFEAVLNLANGSIDFHYASLDEGWGPSSAAGFGTVGVKGANPDANPTLVSFNSPGSLVGDGKAVRIAPVAPVVDYDYYSFTAKAGERVGLALGSFTSGTPFGLELVGPNGTTVLASGVGGAANVASSISGVTVAADGTYFARVRGPAGAGYNVVVTRDVLFGLEPNNSATTAQPLSGAKGALGYLEPTPALTAADSGWYTQAGFHDPSNTNFLVGLYTFASTNEYRDWFLFNVPVLPGPVASARIEIFNPSSPNGYQSPDATETYTLFDVTTSIASLTGGTAGVAGFADLGSGVSYGSVTVSAASNGTLVVISLNAAGLAAVAAAQGGQFAVGGALTTISGAANQFLFGGTNSGVTRQLVIETTAPSDWYSVTLAGDQTALQVETRTPADGVGQFVNTLNPRVAVFDSTGTTLLATGTVLADGRNERILLQGLTPGGTYMVRVASEGGTVGEYFVSATPLRVPAVTTRVDDGRNDDDDDDGHDCGDNGDNGSFHIPSARHNGWTTVTGAGWRNDYTVHTYGVSQTPNNAAVWEIRATSSSPELFVTWVPRPTNATNATYQIFKGSKLLATVVVNQRELPNDGILFGNTYVESLGKFTGIPVNSMLKVKLLTVGANGDVVADAVFDPPSGGIVTATAAEEPVPLVLAPVAVRAKGNWLAPEAPVVVTTATPRPGRPSLAPQRAEELQPVTRTAIPSETPAGRQSQRLSQTDAEWMLGVELEEPAAW